MKRKKIGSRFADYYVKFSNFEEKQGDIATSKQILEDGMKALAEPRHIIIHALDHLKQTHPEVCEDLPLDSGTERIEFQIRGKSKPTASVEATNSTENDDVTRKLPMKPIVAPDSSKRVTRKQTEEKTESSTKPVRRVGKLEAFVVVVCCVCIYNVIL